MSTTKEDMSVEQILEKFAAYCDSTNREIEYDTSDNIDFDDAIAALNKLRREDMEFVIGEEVKPFINGKHPKYGDTVTVDLTNNRDEACKFIQDNGKYMQQIESRARMNQRLSGGKE